MPISSKEAYKSLQGFKPRDAGQAIGEAETKYDIPGITSRLSSLRGLVGNLQSSVEAVDPSVTGRTSGTFTSEGQRQALVSKERAPILGDLGKQTQALGQEQAGFQTASSLASQMASALLSQDQNTYQKLLDQYNAAISAEQAAEQKRQFNETLKAQKEAARAANSGGVYDLSKIVKSLTEGGSKDNSAIKKKALVDVAQMFQRQGTKSFYEEVVAIAKSAGYGNTYDQAKLELIKAKQPGLFPKGKLNEPYLQKLINMNQSSSPAQSKPNYSDLVFDLMGGLGF